MKKKMLLTSVLAIALCVCMITGATFALFTSETEVNIAITSGKVDVQASLGDLYYKSYATTDWTKADNDTTNFGDIGGNAYIDGNTLVLDKVVPGNGIKVNVKIENNSDVAIKYMVVTTLTGTNTDEIVVTTECASQIVDAGWIDLAPNADIDDVTVSVLLPVEATTQGVVANLKVSVLAIQGDVINPISDADKLVETLEKGEDVIMMSDLKISPATMSNAYGTTGINVKNGQTIDGNGYVLDIAGAGGTWDSGISTTGGLIKNITVTGSFRGIFINHNSNYSEKVVLENVTLDGTVYTISCDQGNYQGFEATNSTFKGWTSYAETLGNAKFVGCYFGEGLGYSFCRPYAPTEFVGCNFEAGFEMDARANVTFTNCTIGGVPLTAQNLSTLVISNVNNATVLA